MDQASKQRVETSDEIRRRFMMLSSEEQQEFMQFQESLAGLEIGKSCELRGCVFTKEADGTFSALVPAAVEKAYKALGGPHGAS